MPISSLTNNFCNFQCDDFEIMLLTWCITSFFFFLLSYMHIITYYVYINALSERIYNILGDFMLFLCDLTFKWLSDDIVEGYNYEKWIHNPSKPPKRHQNEGSTMCLTKNMVGPKFQLRTQVPDTEHRGY